MDPRDDFREKLVRPPKGRQYDVRTAEGPWIIVLATSAQNAVMYAEEEFGVYAVDVDEAGS